MPPNDNYNYYRRRDSISVPGYSGYSEKIQINTAPALFRGFSMEVKTMYTPKYLKDIRCEVKNMIRNAEKALEKLETSAEYTDHLHPFHAAAVTTYNQLITMCLTLDRLEE